MVEIAILDRLGRADEAGQTTKELQAFDKAASIPGLRKLIDLLSDEVGL